MDKKKCNPWKIIKLNALHFYLDKALEEAKDDPELYKKIKELINSHLDNFPEN